LAFCRCFSGCTPIVFALSEHPGLALAWLLRWWGECMWDRWTTLFRYYQVLPLRVTSVYSNVHQGSFRRTALQYWLSLPRVHALCTCLLVHTSFVAGLWMLLKWQVCKAALSLYVHKALPCALPCARCWTVDVVAPVVASLWLLRMQQPAWPGSQYWCFIQSTVLEDWLSMQGAVLVLG
jgi:hypothetical protein